ncbi:alpha/beta fold hydrolase [Bacillus sp. 2205SS5-2]|uniref:alpha/beta fold hydrolase n=1 Tax=Bacillus sp. 2205SS5-2 TaxID=3109031 RepID=UPI003006AC14
MFNIIRYQKKQIAGLSIFYREAGCRNNPTIVLLHGFPSSSHMFRNLIPLLSKQFHVIAPDYPGYGNSAMPSPKTYTYSFHATSLIIEQLVSELGITQFFLYVQDYGGPIGFRIAVRSPQKILGLVIQNAVAHEVGLGPPFDVFKSLWKDRNPQTEEALGYFLTFNFTIRQYLEGARYPNHISPDSYSMDQFFLNRPGNDQVQLEYAYDYRKNIEQYPHWQQYLRQYQPHTLIVWGINDFIFTLAGAYAFQKELCNVEINLLCGGHFILEEQSFTVACLIHQFFRKRGVIY